MGTRDVLPPETGRWQALIARFAGQVEAAGYGLRPVADVRGRRRCSSASARAPTWCARRCTTSTTRAAGASRCGPRARPRSSGRSSSTDPATPWKVWYAAPSFRYEHPQAGPLPPAPPARARGARHRRPRPRRRGHRPGVGLPPLPRAAPGPPPRQLHGHRATTVPPTSSCSATWLTERVDQLDPGDRDKVDRPPHAGPRLEAPDHPGAWPPTPRTSRTTSRPRATPHFDRVRGRAQGRSASRSSIDPRLVRGLDYYTHTTFEFVSDALDAAQSTVLGGGRYDGLVEELGGPAHAGHRLRLGHRAGAAGLRRRGRVRRARPQRRRLRRRHQRRSRGRCASPASCAAPGSAPTAPSTSAR